MCPKLDRLARCTRNWTLFKVTMFDAALEKVTVPPVGGRVRNAKICRILRALKIYINYVEIFI